MQNWTNKTIFIITEKDCVASRIKKLFNLRETLDIKGPRVRDLEQFYGELNTLLIRYHQTLHIYEDNECIVI